MKGRLTAVLLAVVVVACNSPTENPASESPASVPSSTATQMPTSTSVFVPPEISFGAVDRGVLVDLRFLDRTDELQPARTDTGGDQVVLTGCRITWFGQYEYEFEWTPGEERGDDTAQRVIDLGFIGGDVGWGVATVEVEIGRQGRFVVPLSNVNVFQSEGDEETTGDTQILDDPSVFACLATVIGPEPVDGEATMTAPLSVELKPPDPIHPPDSIQGIAERTDPIDPTEPYRPLAALAAYLPQFPMDVVYVIPDGVLDSMTLEVEGACLDLSSGYRDGTHVSQHTGCLDGRHEGVAVDEVWTVDAPESILAELQPLLWWGHPGVEGTTDEGDYLDRRDLPEGSTEIYRTEVEDTLVSVVRYVAADGIVTFVMEGVGDNSGGGGFPGEIWNSCYQVQYQDSGYSMIVIADPSWTVTADGQPIDIVDADTVGVAVIPFVISQPSQLEIETPAGNAPSCVSGIG